MQSLLGAVIFGKASFNQIVRDLKDRGVAPMASQSMHERIGATSTAFLTKILSELTLPRFAPVTNALEDGRILRVLIEDASAQVMPKANANEFPAHGNHHGPTAGVKIDLAYDLLAGEVLSHSLQLATEQDKDIGEGLIARLFPGDPMLRDMGYFSLAEFALIEVAADRRKERRNKAKKSGKTPCAKGLVRDGWHLMLANLPTELTDARKLATIYRARWALEIQFRA